MHSIKAVQSASAGKSQSSAAGPNVSFPDALQEAHASAASGSSFSGTSGGGAVRETRKTEGQTNNSGQTKTVQGEDVKKSGSKTTAIGGSSNQHAGGSQHAETGKVHGGHAISRESLSGDTGPKNKNTSSKDLKDMNISGIIGSLIASGHLKDTQDTGSPQEAGSGDEADLLPGVSTQKEKEPAVASRQDIKTKSKAKEKITVKKTLPDTLQTTALFSGAAAALESGAISVQITDNGGQGKNDGKQVQDADLSLAIDSKGKSTESAGLAVKSGQLSETVGDAGAGETETAANGSGTASGESSPEAVLAGTGAAIKKEFSGATALSGDMKAEDKNVDAGKNKDLSEDLKLKGIDDAKAKDKDLGTAVQGKELQGKDAGGGQNDGGQRKDGERGQNGFLSAKQGNSSLAGQGLSGTSSQGGGATAGSGRSGGVSVQGKFILPQGAADAKNIQTALKDGIKSSGLAAGAQGVQTPDKGIALTPGNSGSVNTNALSDKAHIAMARVVPLQDEHFVVTKQADNSIEVRIEPEGLGKMDIKLYMDKGHLNAHINASESIGKEVIEGHLGDIASKLAGEGINVGSFSVSLRNRKNGERQESTGGGDKSGDKTKTIQIEKTGQRPAAVAGGGRLSLFA